MAIGNWRTIECKGIPQPRHECSFACVNDKFYLLGGRRIQPVNEFDPKTYEWKELSPPPFQLHHFQSIVYNNKIYILGAMTGGYPEEPPIECIYIYDPVTDLWSKGPEIPLARRRGSCGAVVFNEKLYMVGGIKLGHTSGLVPWFDCFDPKIETWTTLPDMPNPRDHFPAIIMDNKLYAIGGRDTSYHTEENFGAFFSKTVRAVDCYDFKTNKWTTLHEPLPIGTAAGGIASYKNYILYFGGESGQKEAHNETQCLDTTTGKWSLISPLKRGRHGSQAILYNNRIYIASGSGNKGGKPELDTIEEFMCE